MSGTFNLIKDFMSALNASEQNKTQPYDTQGTVKRVEGDTAWVQFTGSDRETPVQMTIACDVGDTVQARIGGGSAWLTGNLTAPPTDDKKANQAITIVTNIAETVQETVDEALEDIASVEDVRVQYCLSTSSSTFIADGDWSNTPPAYQANRYYWTRTVIEDEDGNEVYGTPQYSQDTQLSVETSRAYATTNAHFWYDSTGAYVTDSTQTDYKASASNKYATRVTPTGIIQSYSGNLLSAWTNSGISFYAGDGTTASNSTPTASFGSGGINIYENGNNVASFGSTLRLGRADLANIQIPSVTETSTGYHSDIYFYYNGTSSGRISSGTAHGYSFMKYSVGNASMIMRDFGGGVEELSVDVKMACEDVSCNNINAWSLTSIGAVSCTSVSCTGVTSSGDILAESDNIKGSDMYTKCTLGEGGSATANCRLGATSGGYYRICLTQGGSSKRYKHDIKPIEEEALDPHRLYDAEVIQFVYNDGYLGEDDCRYNRPLAGFIAEDLYEVYPTAVDVEDGKCETWNYRYLVPPMLALIQEQNERITKLEERLS